MKMLEHPALQLIPLLYAKNKACSTRMVFNIFHLLFRFMGWGPRVGRSPLNTPIALEP